jgi:putative colanic acid biosysnthesis UDP-glucose lipid carrier transferase
MDIAIALPALLVLAPLLAVIAVLIKLETPGPAIFRQRRGGLHGKPFVILKFRTMLTMEDGDHVRQATLGDSRITRLGALLRRTSLDELPQLVNVLRGEMSVVGPRPHALAHDRFYGANLPAYRGRSAVRPGLTGAAQVAGQRGEIRSIEQMAARVACDLSYIHRWSLTRDLSLIIATMQVLFLQSQPREALSS